MKLTSQMCSSTCFTPTVPIARVDLVACLARDAELPPETGHLLTVQELGNEAETFVHSCDAQAVD